MERVRGRDGDGNRSAGRGKRRTKRNESIHGARYQLTRLQCTPPLLVCLAAPLTAVIWEWDSGRGISFRLIFGIAVAGLGVVSRFRNPRVRLMPGEMLVRGWSHRSIKWSAIQDIAVERYFGSKTIVVREEDGRTTRLPAPIGGLYWDPRFNEKFQTISQWWIKHRGPDWAPVPVPLLPWASRADSNPQSVVQR